MATPTEVTRAILKAPPLSLRTLAKMAGVSHVKLVHVKAGAATISAVAAARLAAGLEAHGKATAAAAAKLRRSLRASS